MSWLRTFLEGGADAGEDALVDVERDIRQLASRLGDQRRVDGAQDARIEALEAELGEMKLYLAVVIRLLVARGLVDRAALMRLVETVDRSDGSVDGQFGGDIAQRDTWTGDAPAAEPDPPA